MKFTTLRKTLVFLALAAAVSVSAFAFAGGSGTSSDPYQVATLDDLKAVADNPSAFYKQTKDIVINDATTLGEGTSTGDAWTPFDFSGTYNGGDKYITGLYVTEDNAVGGLFGTLTNATVTNLNLDFALVDSDEYAGILAGKAEGTTSISNVAVSGYVLGKTTKAQNTAGGIVGLLDKDASIDGSVSYATVTGATSYSANVGGVAGYNAGVITNSGFGGVVYGTATYYDAAIGGIAGYNSGEIKNCRTDLGSVGGESTAYINDCFVGGIAGVNKGEVSACENNVEIFVSNYSNADSICAAGGIVGMAVDAIVSENTNNGNVNGGKNGEGGYSFCGGIAGIAVSDSDTHYVDYCDNYGDVTSLYGVAGGIVGRAVAAGEGYVSTKLYVEECYNNGAVSADGGAYGEVAGETGVVGDASVYADTEGSANNNSCSAKLLTKIVAEPEQYGNGRTVDATAEGAGTKVIGTTAVSNMRIVRFTSATAFAPEPVLVKLTVVSDAGKVEALSVDASGLSYASGRITGEIAVEVYRPAGDVTEYNVVIGTSVGNKFVGAIFDKVEGTDRVTVVNIPVDLEAEAGTIYVTALVVEDTNSMKPVCDSVETIK